MQERKHHGVFFSDFFFSAFRCWVYGERVLPELCRSCV